MPHTPGPLLSTSATENEDGSFTAYVHVPGGATVCEIRTRGQTNAEADARLFAAAPDLLQALTDIAEGNVARTPDFEAAIEQGDRVRFREIFMTWAQGVARAAVEKARGK